MSHPMWVRGLKHVLLVANIRVIQVAPHVGAWIETYTSPNLCEIWRVAPHVGAWIETIDRRWQAQNSSVAPLYGHVVFKH